MRKNISVPHIIGTRKSLFEIVKIVVLLIFAGSMDQLLQQIEEYKKEIAQFSATDAKSVEEFRIKWLGTKGIVKGLMGEMKNVPNEQKRQFVMCIHHS